jgi:hypothetical protein
VDCPGPVKIGPVTQSARSTPIAGTRKRAPGRGPSAAVVIAAASHSATAWQLLSVPIHPSSKGVEAPARTLESGSGRQIVGEFARQIAEAEFELVRIRKLETVRFNTVFGKPESTLGDYSELSESLAQSERYERWRFHDASVLCSR